MSISFGSINTGLPKDIVKQIKPGTNYQPKRLDSGIPFLNVRNLQNGQINLQGISFISQEELMKELNM